MKWSVEWLSEVHRSGLAKGVAERAAGDLRAVERGVATLARTKVLPDTLM